MSFRNPLDLPETLNESENWFGAYVALLPDESFSDAEEFLNLSYQRTLRHLALKGLFPINEKRIIRHTKEDNWSFKINDEIYPTVGWKQQFARYGI